MTSFEVFVGLQLAYYADGDGCMAHDVLRKIQDKYVELIDDLPEVTW